MNDQSLTAAANILKSAGLRAVAVDSKVRTLETLFKTLSMINSSPAQAYFVPGRIEVLGKHVDYAGGRSITCATEQGFCLVASPRNDQQIHMIDPFSNRESMFLLDANLESTAGDWTNYPMTVARRIVRNFPSNKPDGFMGCDIAFTSDLPQDAGLSSSSALVVAMFLAIADVNKLWEHPDYTSQIKSDLDLAGYLGAVENGLSFGTLAGDRGVGTMGGSQDHTAILCAQTNTLSRFAYRPVVLEERVRLDDKYLFAIGVSGVHSQKTGNTLQQYNRASQLAADAAELWRKHTGRTDAHLAAAGDSSPDAIQQLRQLIANTNEPIRLRVEQFLDETYRIVPGACQALRIGDMKAFGQLTDESQHGAETKLGNQVPQTMYLANSARKLGALAASAFGAGFGGSVWALIKQDQAEDFINLWSTSYKQTFATEASHAVFVTTRPGPQAIRLG